MTKKRQLYYLRRLLVVMLVVLAIDVLRLVASLIPEPLDYRGPVQCWSYNCPA